MKKLNDLVKCPLCGSEQEYGQMYEYRGAISCGDCFDELQNKRNIERSEIIAEERHKTDRFKGLDMSDSQIGEANREIFKRDIEIAKKESIKLQNYESPDLLTP